jgi:hypothetical protein
MDQKPFQSFADIIKAKKPAIKPPAYPWQDLALRIIKELNIPAFKRSAVFKVCRDCPSHRLMVALNDTKELCQNGAAWKYFFKIIDQEGEGAKDAPLPSKK